MLFGGVGRAIGEQCGHRLGAVPPNRGVVVIVKPTAWITIACVEVAALTTLVWATYRAELSEDGDVDALRPARRRERRRRVPAPFDLTAS